MKKANDIVEKVVFPMHVDDAYDCGKVKEYDSQVNLFQGSLAKFNAIMYKTASADRNLHVTLPSKNY